MSAHCPSCDELPPAPATLTDGLAAYREAVRSGEPTAIARALDGIRECAPSNEPEWVEALAALQSTNRLALAQVMTWRFVEQAGGSPRALLQMASFAFDGGGPSVERVARANTWLDQAMAIVPQPSDPGYWSRLISLQMQFSDYQAVIETINRAPPEIAADFWIISWRLRAELKLGLQQEADRDLQLLASRANSWICWLDIAKINILVHDMASARMALQKALGCASATENDCRDIAAVAASLPKSEHVHVLEACIAFTRNPEALRAILRTALDLGYHPIAKAAGSKLMRDPGLNEHDRNRIQRMLWLS